MTDRLTNDKKKHTMIKLKTLFVDRNNFKILHLQIKRSLEREKRRQKFKSEPVILHCLYTNLCLNYNTTRTEEEFRCLRNTLSLHRLPQKKKIGGENMGNKLFTL